MATHDYVIANGTGAAVRSDLNGALAAIVSNNSSATQPATMYAYQWWADTTTGLLKIRNSANSAWVTLFELDGTLVASDISLGAGTVGAPSLFFTGDSNTGLFSPGADTLALVTASAQRATIDSSGRLLVGTSTTSAETAVVITGSRPSFPAGSGDVCLNLGATPTDGTGLGVLRFTANNGSDVGTQIAGVRDGGTWTSGTSHPGRLVFFTTADGGSSPTSSPPAMTIKSSQEVLIGTSTITANGGILQLKSGITFPATAVAASDANTLDDYEEGTWTPNQGSGLTVVGAFSSSGIYTKIGRQVFVVGRVSGATSCLVGVQGIITSNLPFTVKSSLSGGGTAVNTDYFTLGIIVFPYAGSTTLYATQAMPASGATGIDFYCMYNI